jgi:hypothetical protein
VAVELSRRTAIATALTGAAAVALTRAPGSEAGSASLPRTKDPVLHAVRRLTYGATPALVQHVRDVGLSAWLDEQLGDLPDLSGTVAGLGVTALPLPAVALRQTNRDVVSELQAATFARAAWGDHQLFELIVEAFSNHLSVPGTREQVRELKVVDDREVVRAHVLGTFSDMLVASAQSPAMLVYLSNASSRKPQPNENYARELLELHTVGVHGGYTQRDVRDAAKVLTGLGVDDQGAFVYRPEWHVTGAVRVLGWRHANATADGGLDAALSLVRYLARHRATARRIATVLVRRFVSDRPPAALVASAAKVYLSQGTAIVPVVRHIVSSKAFASATDAKTQRPYEWAAAAVRALGLQQAPGMHADGAAVVGMLSQLGQAPFDWQQPDGYPDTTGMWATTASMLARWNVAQRLVAGGVKGIQPLDVDALVGTPLPTTVGGLVDRVAERMLCHAPRSALRTALIRSTGRAGSARVDQAAIRALTPQLAALVLSSPEAQVR